MTVRLLKLCGYAATVVTTVAGLIGLAAVLGNAVGGNAAATTLPLRMRSRCRRSYFSDIQTTAGDFRILPMISESVGSLRSARVDGQLGFGLLVAGALALLLAEAFRLGAAMREDNESIL